MNMQNWWSEVLHGFDCDSCGRHFPKSVLITLSSEWKEINGKYCTPCYHKIYDLMGYCDSCENEYPKTHLYTDVSKNTICKMCIAKGWEDEKDY